MGFLVVFLVCALELCMQRCWRLQLCYSAGVVPVMAWVVAARGASDLGPMPMCACLNPWCGAHCKTSFSIQSEVILRCGLSAYQSALYGLVKAALKAERDKAKGADKGAASRGVKGVNNTVMELRNICNHPMLRWVNKVHPRSESSSLPCLHGLVRWLWLWLQHWVWSKLQAGLAVTAVTAATVLRWCCPASNVLRALVTPLRCVPFSAAAASCTQRWERCCWRRHPLAAAHSLLC